MLKTQRGKDFKSDFVQTALKTIWNKIFSPATLIQLLVGGFTLSLFIHVPLYTISEYGYFLGEKKDFLIAFLWPSDILLLIIVLYMLLQQRREKSPKEIGRFQNSFLLLMGAVLLNFLSVLIAWKEILIPAISIYYFILLYKGYVLHGTGLLGRTSFRAIFEKVFTLGASGEAILAIWQFSQQHSLGFKYLGETVLGPYMGGVAKIDTGNLLFMRAYGTLPHPNILGAILGIAIIILVARTVSYETKQRQWQYYARISQILIILLALILTFSRAAWLATALGTAAYLTFSLRHKLLCLPNFIQIFAHLGGATLTFLLILLPLVQPRSDIFDKAYTERASYNNAAFSYIQSSPLLGIGPSQSLLHMEQQLGSTVKPWEVQPIHNYYLLYASEFGVTPLLLLGIYFFLIIKRKRKEISTDTLLYGSVLCMIAVLMLFDHYFYTIQPTILIFWLISSYFLFEPATYDTASPT